jgi:hypothetical protein
MTPLLFCVNRGYMEIVRQLIDMGADRNCSDKNVSLRVFCYRCSRYSCSVASDLTCQHTQNVNRYYSIVTCTSGALASYEEANYVLLCSLGSHGAVLRGDERQRDRGEGVPAALALQ